MPPLQKLLALVLLLFLFATTALAAPKAKRPKYGHPTVHCAVKKDGVRDEYLLRGNNWNVTGPQLKAAIETPGTVITGWEYKSAINVDDVHTFKAKFRLPIGEVKGTQKKLAELVEPYPLKIRCGH